MGIKMVCSYSVWGRRGNLQELYSLACIRNLASIIDEFERWRRILDKRYKQHKLRSSAVIF